MQTGHEVLATMHASSVEKLIQRLTGSPINVPKTYIDNLNIAIIISAVRLPDGKTARRIVSINEIVDYDVSSDAFSFVEVFRWDATNDSFGFVPQSYLLERKVAFRRGIPPENKRAIYDELTRTTRLFEKLHTQASNFFDVCRILSRAYMEGLL